MKRRCVLRLVPAIVVLALVPFVVRNAAGQIVRVMPIDVKERIANGSLTVAFLPPFTGDSTKPFDGNAFTELAMLGSDSLVVTLLSDSGLPVEKSKVFFWNNAAWTLEGAGSLADLDSRTGSYALLSDTRAASPFAWDSASFAPQTVRCLRLRAKSTMGSNTILGEWGLSGSVTFTHLTILPSPPRLIPGSGLRLGALINDSHGVTYPYFLPGIIYWSTADPGIATVDEDGYLRGVALGSTTVTGQASAGPISGTAVVSVEQDFRSVNVPPMTVRVALVLQDPFLPNSNRLHEEFGWRDPMTLSNALVRHFREASDSVVNFQFVEIVTADTLFTRYYGNMIPVSVYVSLLKEPGWPTLRRAADSGQIWFDYREFVKHYRYDEKRNSGEIDEVWVFSAPYLGMYESQLLGPNAFWWNSPPIRDGTALTKLLSVMGLNYERGVDQAFHSFGHRSESAMIKAYQDAWGRPWNPKSPNPTPWDLFTRIERDMPGEAHVGNIHFPPNGTSDYNYGNQTWVSSRAENWFRYPYLFETSRLVNVSTWTYPNEPLSEGPAHIGYLRWWYNHLPRYVGVSDGVLNNWWHYILDYEAAVQLARSTTVGVNSPSDSPLPEGLELMQNYPNPFNPGTTIEFSQRNRSPVTLRVYSILGELVRTPLDGVLDAGRHRVYFDASGLAGGVYFYQIATPDGVSTRRMMLLK